MKRLAFVAAFAATTIVAAQQRPAPPQPPTQPVAQTPPPAPPFQPLLDPDGRVRDESFVPGRTCREPAASTPTSTAAA